MKQLTDMKVSAFLSETASESPAPGGGSVSALAGALSAALVSMVASLTKGEKFAAAEEEMRAVAKKAQELCGRLSDCIQRDTDSFNEYMAALRMPKTDAAAIEARRAAMQSGLQHAARVPLETAQIACEIFPLAKAAAERGNPNAKSDGLVAAMLARTAVLGAVFNVRINLGGIKDDKFREEIAAEADSCRKCAEECEREILRGSELSADCAE